jgi:leader peptidase (prepilin peptidase)/N-methyltransferase
MATLSALAELLHESPPLLIGLCVVLGLLVGSFLNVVVYRLPIMLERRWRTESLALLGQEPEDNPTFNLIVPRSACPHCQHAIAWYENVPVLSWLFLRGRCSDCRKPISKRYPAVELTSAILAGICAWQTGFNWWLPALLCASWVLLALALIDFDTTLLPDSLTLPLLWAGLLLSAAHVSPVPLSSAVVGAAAGYLVLWVVFWLFKLITCKEGMGHGDFKLLAALGAWLGWQFLPLVILLSSLVGTLVGGTLLATGAIKRNQGIPFGPYLAAAGWIALLWGPMILSHWLQLMKV